MSVGVFCIGTLAFAAMAALLYVWGYRKSRRMPRRLEAHIGQAIEARIRQLLTEQPEGASLKEIARSIDGIAVGGQLQGYRLQVEDARAAALAVVEQMVRRGQLAEQKGKTPRYVLR